MTNNDVDWFKECHAGGLVKSKMLEVGAGKVQGIANLCEIAMQLGVKQTTGADLSLIDGVDIVADFGVRHEDFVKTWTLGTFSTVCVFNVLEHTFDPITVLINSLSCVESGGTLLVVTPSIWPIHRYPGDFNRLLPDWYIEFAKRNSLTLLDKHFCWLSTFGIEPVTSAMEAAFPTYISKGFESDRFRYLRSRIVNKLLNTYGRSHWGTHSAIGAAFQRG